MIVQAPSNIALIKYMGKSDPLANLPANASLSMTLEDLCSFIEVNRTDSSVLDLKWLPETPRVSSSRYPLQVPKLSGAGIEKFLNHAKRVVDHLPGILEPFGLRARKSGKLELRSANTFPAGSGIASSASSFAGVTLATAFSCAEDPATFMQTYERRPELKRALASLSRQGSGSSCRSFEGPWVLWSGKDVSSLNVDFPKMAHFVVVVDRSEKKIPSSQAHSMVGTSPLWEGRVERVSDRISSIEAALGEGNVREVSRIAWAEMWEMHSLFHTSAEPFTYWEPGTIQVLRKLAPELKSEAPPIITMDAGANVHVMVRAEEQADWRSRLKKFFPELEILEDRQGMGARILVAGTAPA